MLTRSPPPSGGDARARAREVDLLRYQIDEIDGGRIEDGDEDGRLEAEEDRLAAAAAHRQAAAPRRSAWRSMRAAEGGRPAPSTDLAEASGAAGGRAPLAALDARVRAAMAELSDLATELRSVVETWEDDPERLERGPGPPAALPPAPAQVRATPRARCWPSPSEPGSGWPRSSSEEPAGPGLDAEIAEAPGPSWTTAEAAGGRGPQGRRAPILADQDRGHPAHLGHAVGAFRGRRRRGRGRPTRSTFLLGANPGEPLLPLAKAASGGELARTMLAIRLAITDAPGVMVFDEVDAGVGGDGGHRGRAQRWPDLGRHGQVLVVTHLAQVAAQADHQLGVAQGRAVGPHPLRGHRARQRGPGGRVQPDAVGQPDSDVGTPPRPRAPRRIVTGGYPTVERQDRAVRARVRTTGRSAFR